MSEGCLNGFQGSRDRLSISGLNPNKVKAVIVEPNLEIELRPLLLFNGQLTIGRAKSYFNFIQVAMGAEIPTVAALVEQSKVKYDAAHLCGLHAKSGWSSLSIAGFFSRLLQSPSVLTRTKGLKDYVHWVKEQSPRTWFLDLHPIPETSPWSKRQWRRVAVERQPQELIPEHWPYISGTPTSDHDLLLTVDRIVPKHLPPASRADICQDMIVAILTGETTVGDLQDSVPEYMKRFFKQFPMKYGHLSLDAPVFGDSNQTLGDTLVG